MRVAVFCSKAYTQEKMSAANSAGLHELVFISVPLTPETVHLAEGFEAISVFIIDRVDDYVLRKLHEYGVKHIAVRTTSLDHVDMKVADELGINVANTVNYAQYAIAEHAVALAFALDRKIHNAYVRTHEGDFELTGLMGEEMNGRTLGIVGAGNVGRTLAKFMAPMGMRVIYSDLYTMTGMKAMGAERVPFEQLLAEADVISFHCPLTESTYHMINEHTAKLIKPGATIINTSQGALIDAAALVPHLKSGRIAGMALDVYEGEKDIIWKNRPGEVIQDDVYARLQSMPNVIITGQQGWFTHPAIEKISEITINNLDVLSENPLACPNLRHYQPEWNPTNAMH